MPKLAKSYRINLVRSLRELERKAERTHRFHISVGIACFIVLILAILYSGFTVWKMENVLSAERKKLAQVKSEYKKYTATRSIVDKGDVELLNQLQGRGIFWTKQLAALATHLPDNYAITGFSYKGGELKVTGFGYASLMQDQLLTLDGYLNLLRKDSAFSGVFKEIYLNNTHRTEGAGQGRVAFEFSALTPVGVAAK